MAYTRTGYANLAAFPVTGSANIIYVDLSNGSEYLWDGSTYVLYEGTPVFIRTGYQDAAWFAANPSYLLGKGQRVDLLQTGQYKLGDGVTLLSALSFLGGGGDIDVGTSPVLNATNGYILYNNNGTLGEKNFTGTGDVVLATSPTTINHIATPSTDVTKLYALRLTDDGSGTSNPDLVIDSVYNARVLFTNNNTAVTWYASNMVLAGTDLDVYSIGTSSNPYSAFFKIYPTGRTNVRSGVSIFKAPFLGGLGHVPQMTNGSPTTALAYAADQVNMTPFILNEDVSITSLNFIVTTAVAASNASVGIYEWDDSSNNVGALVVTSGLISCATTGAKSYSFSAITLSANKKYVMAYVNDNINIRIYSTNYNSLSYLPVSSSNGNQYSVITKSITAGWTSLPSSITADGGRVQLSPIIGIL